MDDVRYRVNAYKASEWGPQADTSWLAVPYLNLPEMQDIAKVHLVRHPRKVINSLVKVEVFERRDRYGLYTDFAYHWVPEMRGETSAKERAAMFYLCWNELAEQGADYFWRVEDGPHGMLDMLDIPHEGKDVFNVVGYNGRGGPLVNTRLEDLRPGLQDDVLEMCGRYGYDWADD